MIPELLLVALDYHRAPLRYPLLADPARPLPRGFEQLFGDMAAALAPAHLDEVARRLQRRPVEIEAAARFFARHVLLAPGADHYRVLGLSHEASAETVRQHYHLLIRLFHPDRIGGDGEGGETIRLNAAYHALRDPEERVRYDADLRDGCAAAGGGAGVGPPALGLGALSPARSFGQGLRRQPLPFARWAKRGYLVAIGLALVGLVGALALLTSSPSRHALRMTADQADRPAPRPTYLVGGAGPATTAERAGADRVAGGVEPASGAAAAEETGPNDVVGEPARPRAAMSLRAGPDAGPFDGRDGEASAAAMSSAVAQPFPPARATTAVGDGVEPSASPLGDPAVAAASAIDSGNPGGVSQEAVMPHQPAAAQRVVRSSSASPLPTAGVAADADPVPEAGYRIDRLLAASVAVVRAEPGGTARAGPPDRDDDASKPSAAAPQAAKDPDELAALAALAARSKASAATQSVPELGRNGREPDRLVRRFVATYERGDPNAFAGLFTANAQVNEGRGRGFIRSLYGEFFDRVPDRQLTIGPVHWQAARGGALVGEGAVRVGTRPREAQKWRQDSGTIRFELVADGDDYRIAAMFYRLASGKE